MMGKVTSHASHQHSTMQGVAVLSQRWLSLSFLISALLVFLAAATLLGCSSSQALREKPDLPVHAFAPAGGTGDTLKAQSSKPLRPATPDTTASTQTSLPVDVLVNIAREQVSRAAYDSAHYNLLAALERMRIESADPSREAPPDDLYQAITEIYSEKMPAEFLDSIPDEIAADVFHVMLSRSLDSLKTAPADSAAITRLLCQSSATYDMPMVWNDRVLRAMHFFITGKKGHTARWLARSPYYVPFMRSMLAEEGLPQDLAYLPLIESGYNPNAYSRARAAGLWQFIPSTGKRYGLRQSFWIDERRDHYRSTRAGMAYLKKLYEEFGDWYLALASYNCGEGKVRRTIERQGTTDFWQLRLPAETMAYVPEFIAALIVAKNPQCFGFAIPDTLPMDLDTVIFSECLDFQTIAEGIGVPIEELRSYNPHILRFCTPPDVKNFTLYLPKGAKEAFTAFAAQVPTEKKVSWYRYRIQRGDNLGALARQFKIPVDALKSINNLSSNRITAGHYLLIPIPVRTASAALANRSNQALQERAFHAKGLKPMRYRPAPGETFEEIARLFRICANDIRRWNNLPADAGVPPDSALTLYVVIDKGAVAKPNFGPLDTASQGERREYVVQAGDNLSTIARTVGVSVERLIAWNDLNSANPVIYPAQALTYYAPLRSAQEPAAALSNDAGRFGERDPSVLRYEVKSGDNLSMLARLFGVTVGNLLSLNNLAASAVIRPGDILRIPRAGIDAQRPQSDAMRVVYYQVKEGDNLWDIARQFDVPLVALQQINGLKDDSVLIPGDTVRILRHQFP